MLWDVLDYIVNNTSYSPEHNCHYWCCYDCHNEVCGIWDYYRKPIDAQSDECIEYVYKIILLSE